MILFYKIPILQNRSLTFEQYNINLCTHIFHFFAYAHSQLAVLVIQQAKMQLNFKNDKTAEQLSMCTTAPHRPRYSAHTINLPHVPLLVLFVISQILLNSTNISTVIFLPLSLGCMSTVSTRMRTVSMQNQVLLTVHLLYRCALKSHQ